MYAVSLFTPRDGERFGRSVSRYNDRHRKSRNTANSFIFEDRGYRRGEESRRLGRRLAPGEYNISSRAASFKPASRASRVTELNHARRAAKIISNGLNCKVFSTSRDFLKCIAPSLSSTRLGVGRGRIDAGCRRPASSVSRFISRREIVGAIVGDSSNRPSYPDPSPEVFFTSTALTCLARARHSRGVPMYRGSLNLRSRVLRLRYSGIARLYEIFYSCRRRTKKSDARARMYQYRKYRYS